MEGTTTTVGGKTAQAAADSASPARELGGAFPGLSLLPQESSDGIPT